MPQIGPNPDQKRPSAYGGNDTDSVFSVPRTSEGARKCQNRVSSEKSKSVSKKCSFWEPPITRPGGRLTKVTFAF